MGDVNLMQAMLDGMSKTWRKEREADGMTLGQLIEALEAMPRDARIELGEPNSYRGYYEDLSFEPTSETRTVAEALEMIRSECMGQVFYGYKGGEYVMGAKTPIWLAAYGCTGPRIVGIDATGDVIKMITRDED
jgi:hypothetical protein